MDSAAAKPQTARHSRSTLPAPPSLSFRVLLACDFAASVCHATSSLPLGSLPVLVSRLG